MPDKHDQIFSLLHPSDADRGEVLFSENDRNELDCNPLFYALFPGKQRSREMENILYYPVSNEKVINYRLDVLTDLLNEENLVSSLEQSLPEITEMRYANEKKSIADNDLKRTIMRISELKQYIDVITSLHTAFHSSSFALKSEGFLQLQKKITDAYNDWQFQHLVETLPEYQKGLEMMRSVTIGINLDPELSPRQVTIISMNAQAYKGSTMASKLFPKSKGEYDGISPLYDEQSEMIPDLPALTRFIFKDLHSVIKHALRPIRKEVDQFLNISLEWILRLEVELQFYLGATRFIQKVRDDFGLPMCRPAIAPKQERLCQLTDNYNIDLAIQTSYKYPGTDLTQHIVANDVSFTDDGRIFILTGPNSGGKTTYAQAIGFTQLMMQLGLYVPCQSAVMSPVDELFVAFEAVESPEFDTGKLGSESKRISAIIDRASAHSLVLLNESFSSTSPGESFYIMKDIMTVFRVLGLRAVVATHLHELAEAVDRINGETEGSSALISVVAGIKPSAHGEEELSNRTYVIKPGPPEGSSYAKDIAKQYGISLEQMMETIEMKRR